MALFQKKPQVSSSAPLYTLGSNRTLLIVGLGNLDKQYQKTRHNVGFDVADFFAEHNEFPAWTTKKDLRCEITIQNLGESRVILAKPSTFMNNSGEAVRALQHFYKIPVSQTLVAYDELAIEFGQLRTRVGGSDAGHNGVKSLIAYLGEDFGRLRIGVASPISAKADAAEFVLGKFTKEEQAKLPMILKEASAIITEYIFSPGGLIAQTREVI